MTQSLAPISPAVTPRLGGRFVPCARGLVVACVLAAIVVGVLVGPRVLLHPGQAVVGRSPSSDFQIMTWSLAWWPWAVVHGVNPLHTALLWPPGGFSTLWMTTIPFPALLALPVTVLAGPLVAYNLLMVAGVVLATGAAYLLCFELTDRVPASVLGGAVFGLSPYMLGHTISEHLNLIFVFPLPLLALIAVRHARGKTSGRRFVLGAAALLLALAGSSLELLVDLTLVVVIGGVLAVALSRNRKPLLRQARLVGLAYAVCLPVLAPVGVLALGQPHGPIQASPSDYSVDLLNLVVPTPTLLAGAFSPFRDITRHFVGNVGERDGYVGLPLLVICALALRARWRRGVWIAALFAAVAFCLSIGPTPTVQGRPLLALPVSANRLPVVGDALPARMSVFVALGVACLCAMWFAEPGRRRLRIVAATVLVASLLPNLRLPGHVANAWAVSTTVAWSTPDAPAGFVDGPRWKNVVGNGASVLVLPTRDRTAAGYWETKSGLRFALAIPETPFTPPKLAAEPAVARLADNVLPQADGIRLGAARLRAYVLSQHVGAVVIAPTAGEAWRKLVARAIPGAPIGSGGDLVYPVPRRLRPLTATGEQRSARAQPTRVGAAGRPALDAWLSFDGTRAHLEARLHHIGAPAAVRSLSSPLGNAEAPAVAINSSGRAAVAFTEWRLHHLLLRVATTTGAEWRVASLEQSTLPIWSPSVTVAPDGTVLAAWIAVTGPVRALRAASLPPGAEHWTPTITLDAGDGLGKVVLRAGAGGTAVAAWHDSIANESRIQATTYADRRWHPAVTIASSLGLLDSVSVTGPQATIVRWRLWDPSHASRYQARRHGLGWSRPQSSS